MKLLNDPQVMRDLQEYKELSEWLQGLWSKAKTYKDKQIKLPLSRFAHKAKDTPCGKSIILRKGENSDNFNNQKREGIMKVNVEIAKICNQVNRDYCIDNQLVAPAKWDDLSEKDQDSIVSGVVEVIANPKITLAEIHNKHHSVPFKKLPKKEQYKNELFIKTVLNEIGL